MSAYTVLTAEYERIKALRDDAEEDLIACTQRAEEFKTYIGRLTDEMTELLDARERVLVDIKKSA